MATEAVLEVAKAVLSRNDRGTHTIPASGLYPHQWLWDSCFIAIGLARLDPERAATELKSLLRGQWQNGMLPHMIFTPQKHKLVADARLWNSQALPQAPKGVATSGITQPPLLAEATAAVAAGLSSRQREDFLQTMVPAIIRYHQWLYRERDPKGTGLILVLHPWETGLDNTPSWMAELDRVHTPTWIKAVDRLHLDLLFNLFRRDIRHASIDERMKSSELFRLYHAARDLARHGYDVQAILANPHKHFTIESLGFNSILIRNNVILSQLAKEANVDIPAELHQRFGYTRQAIMQLCDPLTGICYHRDFNAYKIEEVPTISIFFPLYSGAISAEHAKKLVGLLTYENTFWPRYPVPSVPVGADNFSEKRYWQGPTWLNTNWLIADGLRRYGYHAEADQIRGSSLELVEAEGCREYFSPLSGKGYGARDFSWTAALAVDFFYQRSRSE